MDDSGRVFLFKKISASTLLKGLVLDRSPIKNYPTRSKNLFMSDNYWKLLKTSNMLHRYSFYNWEFFWDCCMRRSKGKLNNIYISQIDQLTYLCAKLYEVIGQTNNNYYIRTFRTLYQHKNRYWLLHPFNMRTNISLRLFLLSLIR